MNDVAPQNQPAANSLGSRNPLWFLLALLGALALCWLLMPAVSSGPSAPRAQCKNNLKQILIALHAYHDANGAFPPAYVADKKGRPLYSWRVLILPYIDERPLYDKFHLDEPWDSPNNLPLSQVPLDVFHCPSDKDNQNAATTNYLAVVGPTAAWLGEKPVSKKDISDSLERTIHVAEVVNTGILWAEPRDLYVNQMPLEVNGTHGLGISSHHKECANVGFCDGGVRILKNDLHPETLRQLIDRSDGQPISWDPP